MDHEPLIILAFSFHPLLSLSAVCRMQRQTFLKKELMLRKLSVKNDILNLSGIYFILPLSYLARNPINFFIFYYLIFLKLCRTTNTFFAHSLKSLAKENLN